ncbi:MAG TPA: ISKra4 family transposase [Bryobacteraceae bacterium]
MLEIIFRGLRKSGHFDLEAVEMVVRAATHQLGTKMLEQLLSAPAEFEREIPCPCGQSARFHQMRPKRLVTILGPITIERPYYLCPDCHQGHSPRDRELDTEGTEYSPGLRRMMAVVGSETSFEHGRQQLELLAGIVVTTKAVERQAEAIGDDIAQREKLRAARAVQLELPEVLGGAVPVLYIEMDGTQVPMVRPELEGRAGRIEGQPARTREVKVGCIFTQTTTDEQGRPLRDQASTTYTAAIENADEFGRRIYIEAWERGWSRAEKKVLIADGAEWIWNIANQHFPGAIQIVDLYHARQHLWDLVRSLYPNEEIKQKRWMLRQQADLDGGEIEKLVRSLRSLDTAFPELADQIRIEAEYFQRNAARMRYPEFRRQHLFIGSGVIEAGCRTVIGLRLKQSGMFWTMRGANAIIALRCFRLSRKFEDYWTSRSRAA